MPLTAIHPSWGVLDATVGDLGVGRSWEEIHRPKNPIGLSCRGCAGGVHAKVSSRGLKFFSHSVAEKNCVFTGESIHHRLLKSELAAAIRAAGWTADLEVPGQGWRADVLATSPDGGIRIAWEAQLAAATSDDLAGRTWTMRAELSSVVWVTDKRAPWLRHLPSARIDRDEAGEIRTVDTHFVFQPGWCPDRTRCRWANRGEVLGHRPAPCPGHGGWMAGDPRPLTRFVRAVLEQRLLVRPMIAPDRTERTGRESDGIIAWATEADFALETVQNEAGERYEAWQAEQQVLRQQWEANIRAWTTRQHALLVAAVEHVFRATGISPQIDGPPGAEWLGFGVPVKVRGRVVAVICPLPGRITPAVRARLSRMTVLVESEVERARLARVCAPEQRIIQLPAATR